MQLDLIIPTLNEAENLSHLIPRVFSMASKDAIAINVIIVDESSDQQTCDVALRMKRTYKAIQIVKPAKRLGLARSVLEGFRLSNAEFIGVMDADLSHPPEQIPALLDAIEVSGVDVVLASRYCPGGSIKKWSIQRRLISWMSTYLAKIVVKGVADPLSGFFICRRELIHSVELTPIGYKIGLELIVKSRSARVVEVPYAFIDRQKGRSKASLTEGVNFLKHLFALAIYKIGN